LSRENWLKKIAILDYVKIATNVSVLPKAGYSAFRQPIPKLIYFLLPKITFVAD
jgi:hypothetical protein